MSTIKVFKEIKEWNNFRRNLSLNESLGFVPTMGALHDGHLSLIRKSIDENNKTVVSIYVNPTQFNDKLDLKKYPIDFEKDFELLKDLSVDYIIYPDHEEIYKDGYRFKLSETEFSMEYCGKDRPGHFDGVLTVVMKLFNIVKPDRAYFGEKDYQQLCLIRDMVAAFFMDMEIVSCPIVREVDGLAMSSRNQLLTDLDRIKAPIFNKILNMKIPKDEAIKKLEASGLRVDYVDEFKGRRLAAVKLGKVRLIDNETI